MHVVKITSDFVRKRVACQLDKEDIFEQISKEKDKEFGSGDKESQNFIKNKIFKKEPDKKVEQNGQNIIEKASPKVISPTKEEYIYKKILDESERQLLELRSKDTGEIFFLYKIFII